MYLKYAAVKHFAAKESPLTDLPVLDIYQTVLVLLCYTVVVHTAITGTDTAASH